MMNECVIQLFLRKRRINLSSLIIRTLYRFRTIRAVVSDHRYISIMVPSIGLDSSCTQKHNEDVVHFFLIFFCTPSMTPRRRSRRRSTDTSFYYVLHYEPPNVGAHKRGRTETTDLRQFQQTHRQTIKSN